MRSLGERASRFVLLSVLSVGASGPVDITSLFGSETSTFTVSMEVRNTSTPTSRTDTWIALL